MPEISITRRDLEVVSFITIVIVAVWYWSFPLEGEMMMDHFIYVKVFELMKQGVPYYEAMDRALRIVYGPAETTRAFRTGTIWVLWSLFPNIEAVWTLLVALFVGSGAALIGLARYPISAVPAATFLIVTANIHQPTGLFLQFTTTELWAAPFIILTMLLWKKEYWKSAAIVALSAALIRETTAHLLIAGLVASFVYKKPRVPWLIAIAIATAAYVWHFQLCAPYLVMSGGRETKLFYFGDVLNVFGMMGFSLPLSMILGPLLWLLAIWRLAQDDAHHRLFAVLFLLLPWVGLLVDRPYWGILFVPLTLLWGFDGAILLAVRSLGRAGIRFSGDENEGEQRDDVEDGDDESHVSVTES